MSLQQIQDLHKEIIEKTKKKKDLGQVVKDAFENIKEYKELVDEMDKLREKRKQIEVQVRQQYASEFNDLQDIAQDIKDTRMVLSDLIWNEVMKNTSVEVKDEYDNKYVPHIVASLQKEK